VTKATSIIIDVGWSYRLMSGPTRLVVASKAGQHNWPPDDLLHNEKKKGIYGKIKTDHPEFPQYEKDAVEFVESFIDDGTLIVMPELSGSKSIEQNIKKLLDESEKHCIVIGGSYYRDSIDPGRVEHVCPVLIPHRETYYQRKFVPAPIENPGFDIVDRRVVLIFKHTGFGDFAVLVCSDALPHEARNQYVDKLRNEIDFLVIPARNVDPQLPGGLRTLADNERWCVVYCSGNTKSESQIISSYKHNSGKVPEITDHCTIFDLSDFQRDMQADGLLHTRTAVEQYFEPRPRHWPYRGLRASGFSDHLRVVAIGSHFDDVWLGCSGTLMRLRECYNAQIRVVTLCSVYPSEYYDRYKLDGRPKEDLYEDLDILCRKLGFKHEQCQDPVLIDQSFNEAQVHSYMKALDGKSCHTDLLFVPRQDDVHHDHMVTAQAAILEFRGANVFEYEIKDFRRSQFKPNLLVDLGIRSNERLELGGAAWQGVTFAEKKAFILEHAFRIMDPRDLPPVVKGEHTLGRLAFRASQSGTELTHAEAFVAETII
jgi:LmbE family N-acetylglucosaminyl deacetylase